MTKGFRAKSHTQWVYSYLHYFRSDKHRLYAKTAIRLFQHSICLDCDSLRHLRTSKRKLSVVPSHNLDQECNKQLTILAADSAQRYLPHKPISWQPQKECVNEPSDRDSFLQTSCQHSPVNRPQIHHWSCCPTSKHVSNALKHLGQRNMTCGGSEGESIYIYLCSHPFPC